MKFATDLERVNDTELVHAARKNQRGLPPCCAIRRALTQYRVRISNVVDVEVTRQTISSKPKILRKTKIDLIQSRLKQTVRRNHRQRRASSSACRQVPTERW